MTSNEVLTDYMAGARKFSSNGELRRFLEWTPNVALQWNSQELEAVRSLKMHFGVAGEAFIRWVVRNQSTARRLVEETYDQLRSEMGFSGDERYWNAGTATTADCMLSSVFFGPGCRWETRFRVTPSLSRASIARPGQTDARVTGHHDLGRLNHETM